MALPERVKKAPCIRCPEPSMAVKCPSAAVNNLEKCIKNTEISPDDCFSWGYVDDASIALPPSISLSNHATCKKIIDFAFHDNKQTYRKLDRIGEEIEVGQKLETIQTARSNLQFEGTTLTQQILRQAASVLHPSTPKSGVEGKSNSREQPKQDGPSSSDLSAMRNLSLDQDKPNIGTDTLPAICFRCPDPKTAEICKGRLNIKECTSTASANDLWPGYLVNDGTTTVDSPASNKDECTSLLFYVVGENKKLYARLTRGEISKPSFDTQKAIQLYGGVRLTKEILEPAFQKLYGHPADQKGGPIGGHKVTNQVSSHGHPDFQEDGNSKGTSQMSSGKIVVPLKSQNIRSINMSESAQRPFTPRPSAHTASFDGATDDQYVGNHKGPSVVTNYITVKPKITSIFVYTLVYNEPPENESPQAGSQSTKPRPISQRGERKRVFAALAKLPPLQGREDFATDYETLWVGSALDPQHPLIIPNVTYHKQSGKEAVVRMVEFRYQRTLNFSNGAADLAGSVNGSGNANELTRALNGMVTSCITSQPQNNLFECGPNKFFLRNSAQLRHPNQDHNNVLMIQRGYFTSVRPGTKSVLLNVNITHGTFFKPILVSDFLDGLYWHAEHEYGGYKQHYKLLKGRTVRIIYDRPTLDDCIDKNDEANRTKVISGVGLEPHLQTFEIDNQTQNVRQWFQSQGIPVHRTDLLCINVGIASRPLWIPAELLELMPDQPFTKQLGSEHMRIMLDTALQRPAMNHAAIQNEGLRLLGISSGNNTNHLRQNLFLGTGKNLLRIPATILPVPTVAYQSSSVRPNLASWNVRDAIFTRPAMLIGDKLSVLDFRPGNARPSTADVANIWLRQCEVHGLLGPAFQWSNNPADHVNSVQQVLPDNSSSTYFHQMQSIMQKAQKSMKDPKFMVVILPAVDSVAYGAIKRVGETKLGLHTICVTAPKVRKNDPQIYSNMLLKQNLKAPNGQNHAVLDGTRSAFAKLGNNTLVIGVDVVHPGGTIPSIAAMVGSAGPENFSTFPGRVRLQSARQEVLDQAVAREMVRECIVKWINARTANQPLNRIVYYRDGVGEDQYDEVLREEVTAIGQAFNLVAPPQFRDKIAITVIVVGKRHHTRFFAPNDSMTYDVKKNGAQVKNGNIKPGLLVDSVITQPAGGFQDFFLQSHAALAGTAKSAHYVVLRNDPKTILTLRDLQTLTHAFCYNYARATKGVSYCSPAYYADRLCDRAHHYMKSYMSTQQRSWQQGKQEKDEDFRARVRDDIASDTEWKPAGNTNPWHPSMDNVMFWL